jgi:hypothetical protein
VGNRALNEFEYLLLAFSQLGLRIGFTVHVMPFVGKRPVRVWLYGFLSSYCIYNQLKKDNGP